MKPCGDRVQACLSSAWNACHHSMGEAAVGRPVKVPTQGPRGQEEEEAWLGTAKGEAGLQGAIGGAGSDVSPNLGRVDGRLATT